MKAREVWQRKAGRKGKWKKISSNTTNWSRVIRAPFRINSGHLVLIDLLLSGLVASTPDDLERNLEDRAVPDHLQNLEASQDLFLRRFEHRGLVHRVPVPRKSFQDAWKTELETIIHPWVALKLVTNCYTPNLRHTYNLSSFLISKPWKENVCRLQKRFRDTILKRVPWKLFLLK